MHDRVNDRATGADGIVGKHGVHAQHVLHELKVAVVVNNVIVAYQQAEQTRDHRETRFGEAH